VVDWRRLIALCGWVVALACDKAAPLQPTVLDLKPIHGAVTVSTAAGATTTATSLVRARVGDTIETDANGRARARLDDGTTLLVDRASKVKVGDATFTLEAGRVFVNVPIGTQGRFGVGDVTLAMSDGSVSLENAAGVRAYVARGELSATRAGSSGEHTVRSGELLTQSANDLVVAPGRAFEDWTQGLMAPWAAHDVSRRALGEVWGRTEDSMGSPLAIRSHEVTVTIDGEVAKTKVATRYFNGGSTAVVGDFRFALPTEAIVSSFRYGSEEALTDTKIALAERDGNVWSPDTPRVEWAGEGWLRGRAPFIDAGAVFTMEVEYVEWLAPVERDGRLIVQYRYPMVAEGEPPLLGEFTATVDAGPSKPTSLGAGMGAKVEGNQVHLRRSDFRPTADLVVEVGLPPFKQKARMYRVPAPAGDDGGDYLIVRTEAPPSEAKPTPLVLVVDTSRSVERSGADAARAFVRATLASLADTDSVLILAADQSVQAIGGDAIAPLTPERRKALQEGVDTLTFGGATDLGAALEAAVRAVPKNDPRALIVYVGDGWATLGDESLAALRARLARNAGFSPRLGAVSVGSSPNRILLSALTRGAGPMFEVHDTVQASEVAIDLVALSLKPAVTSVSLDLGLGIERAYPTHPVTVAAGEPITFLGRVLGQVPQRALLRFRDADQTKELSLGIEKIQAADAADVRRRWARARVEDLVLEQKGRELVTDVALASGLITPWTALTPDGARYRPLDISALLLDVAYPPSGGLVPTLQPSEFPESALKRPTTSFEVPYDDPDIESALAASIRRKLADALDAVRACRDSRAAISPGVPNSFSVVVKVDGHGVTTLVEVRGQGRADTALERCIQVVVSGLSFPNLGLDVKVEVNDTITLPPYVLAKNRRCSAESKLPLGSRRGVWQEELRRASGSTAVLDVYMNAKRDCEARTWKEKVTLLTLVLQSNGDPNFRLQFMRDLLGEGQNDAADFIRRETLAGARSPDEFQAIEAQLVGSERLPFLAFKKDYLERKTDQERLDVVRKFLLLAPHDDRLRALLVALLQATDQKVLLLEQVRSLREDPFTNVGLLADGARALRQMGFEAEARRTFGELIERAPRDPWARAFLGDRLRNEGYYDDATLTYLVLESMVSDDPRVTIRQALSHAGAGRLDIARRMLMRVAETGGREGDVTLARLGRQLLALLVSRAMREDMAEATKLTLEALARQAPHLSRGSLLVIEAPAAQSELQVKLEDPDGSVHVESPFVISDPGMGLYSMERAAALEKGAVLTIQGPERPAPLEPIRVRIETLSYEVLGANPTPSVVVVPVDPKGEPVKLVWDGAAFQLQEPKG
jgi:tetratricopeptide (TPR) repeat protein